MRGLRVTGGMVLINFNTKLQPQTKRIIDALVIVKKMAGHRELIEDLLKVYEEAYPQDFLRANEYLAFIDGQQAAAGEAPLVNLRKPDKLKEEEKNEGYRVFICNLEDGNVGLVAAKGPTKAQGLLGVTFRWFKKRGGEVGRAQKKLLEIALAHPEQVFIRPLENEKAPWVPGIRPQKTYRG